MILIVKEKYYPPKPITKGGSLWDNLMARSQEPGVRSKEVFDFDLFILDFDSLISQFAIPNQQSKSAWLKLSSVVCPLTSDL